MFLTELRNGKFCTNTIGGRNQNRIREIVFVYGKKT